MKIDFSFKTPNQVFEDLSENANLKEGAMDDLLDSYTHISRGYHGIFHIAFLWYCHEKLASNSKWINSNIFPAMMGGHRMPYAVVKNRIVATILAHDKVYDANSTTNEIDSAIWFRKHTLLKGNDKLWVGNAIEASANHFADYPLVTEDDFLLQWFLGLDLIPLAAPWEIFRHNQLMIRAEYSHMSDFDWNQGRRGFLEKVRTRFANGSIYNHPFLHKMFEKTAQDNILRSLTEA